MLAGINAHQDVVVHDPDPPNPVCRVKHSLLEREHDRSRHEQEEKLQHLFYIVFFWGGGREEKTMDISWQNDMRSYLLPGRQGPSCFDYRYSCSRQ